MKWNIIFCHQSNNNSTTSGFALTITNIIRDSTPKDTNEQHITIHPTS